VVDFTLNHEGEVRRDLVVHGYRLDDVGTEQGLCWSDFVAFVLHAQEGSAIFRALFAESDHPEDYEWSNTNMLLAAVVDGINALLWQNGGGSKATFPDPVPRPGHRPQKAFAADAVEIEDINARLGIVDLL